MRRHRKVCSLLASLLFFLPVSVLYAQTNNYSIQVLTLGVQDRRGKFVEDIQPDQIVIKGLAATVQRFELDNAPRRILLLLDTSGSMGNYKSLSWSNVVQFTIRFALQRKGDDSIGLDTFAEKDQALVPFTTDSESLHRVKGHRLCRCPHGRSPTSTPCHCERRVRLGVLRHGCAKNS